MNNIYIHMNRLFLQDFNDLQTTVDVLAVVKEVQPLGSVKRKSDGQDLARRDVTIVDQR